VTNCFTPGSTASFETPDIRCEACAELFALSALLIASVGLYGLLAFIVAERTREIGLGMALGARASEVVGMIIQQGYGVVLAGGSVGLIAAFGAARFLKGLLFGITPSDPFTFTAVTIVLALVTLLAALIPARRATLVKPISALRGD
jgi:ABC-type antimicrobial peptide transport system permease subunit